MSRFIDARYQTLTPYTPGEQPQKQKFIKLNTNESPYPPSPAVRAALTGEEIDALRLYSDPEARALCEAITAHYGLPPAQVLPSNGSDEILAFAFLAFCGEKGVAFPAVSYGFYPVFAELFSVKARAVPLREDFTLDADDYLTPGENVVIANPNAPTGLALPLSDIEKILKAHPDDVVLIDEAYVDFGAESAVKLLPRYENLLIVQTFSKSRALAGQRVGFALANEGLINDLKNIKYSFNPYNMDRLAILAGAAAMRDEAYFESCRRKIIATRDKTADVLREAGFQLTDSRANFLFVRYPGVSGAALQQALREKGLLVRRFEQESIQDWLRVSVGSKEEMEAFTAAVIQSVKECQA
ncbi:MAG: histidinol-phosphate transaminase [Oscillospiraceae bacterium]|nr:histidinol-phosphate transaminase [Oscillospiraceae bacterium]